jgi:hypothetical protein
LWGDGPDRLNSARVIYFMIISEPSNSYGKDAYYFSHDSNARNDAKCLRLRRVLGMEGYGIFWVLVEMLRESSDYKLPLSVIPDIAYETRVSEEKILAVINNFGLFEVEHDDFFSIRLIRSMEKMQLKSNKNRSNALKRWNNANALPSHSERNALKESKGKETKENEIIFDLESNPYGLHIYVKEGICHIQIHQQSFDKYLNGCFGAAYEQQKMVLKTEPPISEFFKQRNGDIFNDNSHLWNSFKKIWIQPTTTTKPNPGKIQ